MLPHDTMPRLGSGFGAPFKPRFLLIGWYDPNSAVSVWKTMADVQCRSRHRFDIVNLWPGRGTVLELPETLDLDDYAGLMIDPSVSDDPAKLTDLDRNLKVKFKDFDTIKISAET